VHRRYTAVAVALAVLLAGVGVGAALDTDQEPTTTSAGNNGGTVAVGASGSAAADPDRAVVTVAVVTTGDTATAVRDQLATDADGMRAALREAGVTDDQIRTTSYGISQTYESRESEIPRYRGVHGFRVTLDDIEAVGTVVDAAVAGGASRVERVQFTLSEEREREVRAAALADAMANARAQADALADAGDLRLDGVVDVSTTQGYGGPVAFESAADGARTSFETGPVSVTVRVQVTYAAA
jgi:hypothetical protein